VILFLKTLTAVATAIVSGMFIFAAFPPFELSFLAWVALIPLFLTIAGKRGGHGFLLSLLYGIAFLMGIFNWILEVPKFTYVHHAILALYLGSYFGFFGLAFCVVVRRWGIAPALFAAPFLWVSLEYLRSNLGFLALPWGLLAHSQYRHPAVIQVASLTGAYGISFLIVLVNSALAGIVMSAVSRLSKGESAFYHPLSRWSGKALILTASACIAFALTYGYRTVSSPLMGEGIKVSVVQGNILQKRKWDPKYAPLIMKTYAELTEQASKDSPDLIVWPEAATPRAITRDREIYSEVRKVTAEAGTYLLLGSSQHRKFKSEEPGPKIKYLNSAFLIDPEQGMLREQRYKKIRLLPFGEYLPHENVIPWSFIRIPDIVGYIPGEDFTVFALPTFRFGVTICWESIFPDMVRQFVNRGAQFIINITNEAWFGKTAAPYQFVSMSVFRAVENRVFVVRCANTGVSCFIDPRGRVVDRVKDSNGQDIFVRGVKCSSVVPLDSRTLYTRYGDWLVWLSFVCSLAFILFASLRTHKRANSIPDHR